MRNLILSNEEKLNTARERFIQFVVEGQRDATEAAMQCRVEKLSLSGWGPLFCVVEVSLHMDMYPAEHLDSSLLHMEETTGSFLKHHGWAAWTYINSRNSIMVVLSGEDKAMFNRLDSQLTKLLRKMMEEYGVVIYAGIGGVVSQTVEIRDSAKEANTCISYKYTAARDNVVHIKNIRKILSNAGANNTTAFDRVVGCFMDGDLQKLNVRLNELLRHLEKTESDVQNIRQAYLELITHIMHHVTDAGVKFSEEQSEEYLQYVLREKDMHRLKNWFVEQCSDFIRQMSVKRQENTSHIGMIARQFVERNYGDPDLSQQDVSDHLGLSVGYFGQLFFSQTGQRFVDYLHQYRLEIAQRLLLSTNDKIRDISVAVGFHNVNYFNSLFKKSYGITPKVYRQQRQQ